LGVDYHPTPVREFLVVLFKQPILALPEGTIMKLGSVSIQMTIQKFLLCAQFMLLKL